MAAEVIEALLRYSVERTGITDVVRANERVIQLLGETRKQVISVEDAAERMAREFASIGRNTAIDNLTNDIINAARKTKDWKAAIDDAAVALAKLGASDREIQRVTQQIAEASTGGGRGQRVAGALGRFGREVRALPAIQLSGNLSTDAIGKILYTVDAALSSIGATATQVGAATALAAPALIGLVIAMNQFNESIAKNQAALQAAISAQDNYFQALQEQTTEEVQARIAELQRSQPIIQQQITETQNAINAAFNQLQQTFGDAGARVLIAAGKTPIGQLEEQLSTLQEEFSNNEQTVVRLTQGLETGVFAANDMLRAEEELAAKREDEAQKFLSGIEQEIRDRAELNNLIINGSQEQKRQRLDQLLLDRQVLEAQLLNAGINQEALGITDETLREMRDDLARLNDDIALLQGNLIATDLRAQTLTGALNNLEAVTLAAADAAKQQIQAERELLEERLDILTNESQEALDLLVKAEEDLVKLRQDEQRAIEDLNADIAEIIADANDRRAQAEADYQEKLSEAEEDARESREEAQEEHLKRLAAIENDYNRDRATAIRDRDERAALLAEEARKEALEEENSAYDERLEDIEDALRKQTEAARKQLDRQLQNIEYNAREAIETQRRAYEREKRDRDAAITQRLVDIQNLHTAERTIRETYNALIASDLYKAGEEWRKQLLAGVKGGTDTGGAPPGGANAPPTNPYVGQIWVDPAGNPWVWNGTGWQRGYYGGANAGNTSTGSLTATGGNAGGFGLPNMTPPGALSGARGGAAGVSVTGGVNIPIHIDGRQMTPNEIRREVDRRLVQGMRQAGLIPS